MITLHFHLLPQYKYELFHIYFTWSHCTGRNELNKLTLLPMCGFIAQLVEHRTGIAEVMGSNPVEALIFFRLLLSSCLNWKIYCDDHTSLSSTTAVQIWIISYIFHRTVIVCETSAKFLLISYSSSFGIQIKDIYSVFGDSFWPRPVGRTATKLSCVTQKSLHCSLHYIASRRHFECYFLRARITYHQESAGKIPGEWAAALLSPRPHSFRFKQKKSISS